MDWFLSLFETPRGWNAVALALGSVFVYAFVSNLAARPFFAQRLGALETSRSLFPKTTRGIVFELLRFGFYVGVPFVALNAGWTNLPSMGLGLLDWAEGVRWAIVIMLAAWLVLMVIWLPYLRATGDIYAPPNSNLSLARRLVELIYMQAHWAFYRAAAIGLFTLDNGYWGTAVGLGLICLEAFTNPHIRQQLTRLGQVDGVVWNFGQAVLNALGFIVTRNLFLLAFIQLALEITVPHLRAAPRERANASPPPLPRAREQN